MNWLVNFKNFIQGNNHLKENFLSYDLFRGDPRHFCNLAFPILDKDRNGFISFVEYMPALSLTLPCVMEQKVSLV
jgi:hypothetical protein